MFKFIDADFINIVELLFGSISMALGILLFSIMCKKNKNVKKMYLFFNVISVILMTLFFYTKNIYLMSLCLCFVCFFGTAGFGAGYHFLLLSTNVKSEYRGLIFALGYGLGSICTYFLILLPEKFYSSVYALLLYIPVIILNVFLILKNQYYIRKKEEKYESEFKNYFLKISIIVLSMSLLSALSTDIISFYTIDMEGGFGSTRLYYSLGLLIAGFLSYKKKTLFEVLTLVSFIFALFAIILLKDGYSISLIAALSYFFVGFFVIYRTITFLNTDDVYRSTTWCCAFGLMYSRIMEGLLILFEDKLINNYTILILVISICLSFVIILYFLLYTQNLNSKSNPVRNISIKYKLSAQEEKVLNLLIKDLSNQDMANELFVSVNTIRNHVANIYKKTNMKKNELKKKCYLGTD